MKTKTTKLKPETMIALGIGAYIVYRMVSGSSSAATPAPNQGDPATQNTGGLNSLPGLPSMQGLGGCGCKGRH